jgi:hypothetical protein
MPKPRAKISLKKEDKKKKVTHSSPSKEKELKVAKEDVIPIVEVVDIVQPEIVLEEKEDNFVFEDNKDGLTATKYPNYRKIIFRVSIGLISFILLIIGTSSFFNNGEEIADSISKDKINEMIVKLGEHVEIPKDTPTVAKVSDVSLLQKENPFFYRSASVGDFVFVFKEEAILYDAIKDKIKVLMPLNNSNLNQ